MGPCRLRASSAISKTGSATLQNRVLRDLMRTFQLFSFLTLFVVEHQSLQMLLFDLVLHLCRPCLDSERRLRGNRKLPGLSTKIMMHSTSTPL